MRLVDIGNDEVLQATLESCWGIINRHFRPGSMRRFVAGVAMSSHSDNTFENPAELSCSLPLPFLWMHETFRPIGKIVKLEPGRDALRFTAELLNSGELEWAEQVWQGIVSRQLIGCSIGMRRRDNSLYGKKFADTALIEISLADADVTADRGARICKAWQKSSFLSIHKAPDTLIWDEAQATGPKLPELRWR